MFNVVASEPMTQHFLLKVEPVGSTEYVTSSAKRDLMEGQKVQAL